MTKLAVEKKLGRTLEGMRCAVSGSGNVAQFAAEKLLELGAKVITLSDSNGVLVFEGGLTEADLKVVVDCKNVQRGRLSSLEGKVSGRYIEGGSPWSVDVKYDLALPSATQNEIDGDAARRLVKNGVLGVLEV
jgi:glutamate dehydrogenase (NADP+)